MTERRQRIVRRALHGVLLLDKSVGVSSNDALQRVKWLFRADKAGHTGTLDPLASGLLPICLGAATKFSQISLDADKTYLATLRMGQRTTTADGEGDLINEVAVNFDRVALDAACVRLSGEIDQVPPMHAAIKKDGRPLYEYARAGIEVEREARRVTIHQLDIVSWHDTELTLAVRCSKGTYIRTLASDLGDLLGCGAWLSALRRTACGGQTLADAVTVDQLAAMTEEQRDALLRPADALIDDWPSLRLDASEAGRFLSGLRRRVNHEDARVRVFGPEPGAFLGSARVAAGELIADRLLSPVEVQALIAA
jgi:tRNA pseudouridine55 synthase